MLDHPAPYYINEHQSDLRGIKDGWYAMKKDGNFASGPFASREACLRLFNAIAAGAPNAHNSFWT